jgi:hypothetical protein
MRIATAAPIASPMRPSAKHDQDKYKNNNEYKQAWFHAGSGLVLLPWKRILRQLRKEPVFTTEAQRAQRIHREIIFAAD